jgi:uncharacterized membrane protein
MKVRSLLLGSLLSASFAFAQYNPPPAPPPPPTPGVRAVPPVPPVPALPPMGMFGPPGMSFGGPPGIPPQAAAKAGISQETQKKVRDLSFEANEQLISLEAELKRAQLDLEKTLSQTQVDESAVMNKLEVVSRAELAVRKNRMGLLVRIRKTVGADAWEKLQAEMPGPMLGGMGGRREVRVIRTITPEGGETEEIRGGE